MMTPTAFSGRDDDESMDAQIGATKGPFPRRLTERPHPGRAPHFRPLRNNAAHNGRPGVAARGRRRAGAAIGNPRPNWAGARHRRADTPGASAWEGRYRRAGLQLQSNRPDGGGRGAGTAGGSPRWGSHRRMTTGASLVAPPRIRPPHRVQANTSTPNVCRISSGHDHLRDAGGGGASTLTVVAGSLLVPGGGADSGSLWCPPSVTTGSRCAAPLASLRPNKARPAADNAPSGSFPPFG